MKEKIQYCFSYLSQAVVQFWSLASMFVVFFCSHFPHFPESGIQTVSSYNIPEFINHFPHLPAPLLFLQPIHPRHLRSQTLQQWKVREVSPTTPHLLLPAFDNLILNLEHF